MIYRTVACAAAYCQTKVSSDLSPGACVRVSYATIPDIECHKPVAGDIPQLSMKKMRHITRGHGRSC